MRFLLALFSVFGISTASAIKKPQPTISIDGTIKYTNKLTQEEIFFDQSKILVMQNKNDYFTFVMTKYTKDLNKYNENIKNKIKSQLIIKHFEDKTEYIMTGNIVNLSNDLIYLKDFYKNKSNIILISKLDNNEAINLIKNHLISNQLNNLKENQRYNMYEQIANISPDYSGHWIESGKLIIATTNKNPSNIYSNILQFDNDLPGKIKIFYKITEFNYLELSKAQKLLEKSEVLSGIDIINNRITIKDKDLQKIYKIIDDLNINKNLIELN